MFARRALALPLSLAASLTLLLSSATVAVGPSSTADRVSVVVVFDDAVADPAALVAQLGDRHGFTARHVYGAALKGFVASVPSQAVAALSSHPRVRLVELEVAETIIQDLPTGVDRIEVDKNPHADVDGTDDNQVDIPVAVIDTGIDSDHPDLNVIGVVSMSGGDGEDKNGHGTHVAGTIGAVGNSIGVVGVAPGAPVYGVQVCKPGGICLSGDIVAGIDHVAELKALFNGGDTVNGINFAAANFSISSADTTQPCNENGEGVNATHTAICGLVAEGVVFAMAGGNDAREKDAFPEAFAVAAIADFDGKGGGAGSPTCRTDEDDTLANFSNWGVDIAAPGTCILSTWLNGGYNTISGTSMATPHVAGAVAFYLHATGEQPATSASGVTDIETAILGAAHAEGTSTNPCSYDNERNSSEPLLFVNHAIFNGTGECDVTTTGGGNGTLTVDVSTDKSSYVNRESVLITVVVTDGRRPVNSAAVHVDVTTANGRVHAFDGSTDATGTETFSFRINTRRDGTGTYNVEATATKGGASGGGSTSFDVD